MSLTQLRDDLKWSEGVNATDTPSGRIIEAARLVVEGREVWWCEPHASVQAGGREHCQAWYLPDTDVEQGCRMVRMILIDGDNE